MNTYEKNCNTAVYNTLIHFSSDNNERIYALLSVSLLKKDDFFGRKLLKRYRDGSDYIAVYESNPGAAGHYSYEKRTYHIILDSRVFSVKLLKSSERFASSDGIPSAEK